jgi:hypothetical protein
MARIVVGTYMVRYPLGGVLSSGLQWLLGLKALGHEVYAFEIAGYPGSCYDPSREVMTDDCSYGIRTVQTLFARFGLGDAWCYADASGRYHGKCRDEVESVFARADLFIDRGTHGAWLAQATATRIRLLFDGEPAFNQIKMHNRLSSGQPLTEYDYYYTVGWNIGRPGNVAPTAGRNWCHMFHPVVMGLVEPAPSAPDAPFTTIMNWRSHDAVSYNGRIYGQKDVEFGKFMALPSLTHEIVEVAVSGATTPRELLARSGWRVRDAHDVTATFDSYLQYVANSKGEFSVAKQVFVDTNSAWFSDRSAMYLAAGRPVVLQETGFSSYLPCGEGLFAVHDSAEAAAALDEIAGDYARHSARAREIAGEYLDATKVLARLLNEIGL